MNRQEGTTTKIVSSKTHFLLIFQFLLNLFSSCSVVAVCHWFGESKLFLRQPTSIWLTPLLHCSMVVLNTGYDVPHCPRICWGGVQSVSTEMCRHTNTEAKKDRWLCPGICSKSTAKAAAGFPSFKTARSIKQLWVLWKYVIISLIINSAYFNC